MICMISRDAHILYARCMENDTVPRFTATDISTAYTAPFSLYCKYHVDHSKMDSPDSFYQALSVKGIEHEESIRMTDYPDINPMQFDTTTPEEGFRHALDSMMDGTNVLSNPPIFYLPDGMYGYPDILERCNGSSLWGDYHYIVREITIATNIRLKHMLQAAFYTQMIGRIQGYTPDYFLITNSNKKTTQYTYTEYTKLLKETFDLAKQIRNGMMPPAVYGAGGAQWDSYCNELAIQNNDISLIPGIGANKRIDMVDNGFRTVSDVAVSSMEKLQTVRGVGRKTAVNYIYSARAIESGVPIKKDYILDLPHRSTEIFLDLEGLTPVFDDTLTDYLIGALVRKDGKEKYHAFIAEQRREEVMLKSFLDFMEKQDDYVVYHWHNYERAHLCMLMERYNMTQYDILNPNILIDLFSVATNAFAFPTYKNSIKDIAKYLGFSWRHDNIGAMSAIDLYLKYADCPESNKKEMQLVMDYNEDDCIATRVIKDWLATQD